VGDGVALLAGLLDPLGVTLVLGLGDLPVQVLEAAPVGLLGLVVEDGVGPQGQAGPGQSAAARQGDQLGRRDRLAGPGEQHGQVAHALGVGQPHPAAGVAEGPGGAGAAELGRPGRGVPGRQAGLDQQPGGVGGQLLQSPAVGLGPDGGQQLGRPVPLGRVVAQ
jgi:hypothetical protein